MTGSKVFLDTTPLIYLLDNDENFGMKTARLLSLLAKEHKYFVSSVITCTEYLVVPYRTNNMPSIEAFWDLVNDCPIAIHPITKEIAEKAAKFVPNINSKQWIPCSSLWPV